MMFMIATLFLFIDIFLFLYNFCEISIVPTKDNTIGIDTLKFLIYLNVSTKITIFCIPLLFILSFF